MRLTRTNIIGGIISVFLFGILFGFVRGAFAQPASPDELARQARELRLQARSGHCEKIGAKVAECYAGNMQTCKALGESIAWFSSEYGELPELACSTVPDPLEFGDVRML